MLVDNSQNNSKKAILTYTLGALILAAIPLTTVLIQQPAFFNQKAQPKQVGVIVNKSVVEVNLSRKEADKGKVFGLGFLLSSTTAEGWQLNSLEEAQGVGFHETMGTLKPGGRAQIRAFINTSKPNGKYIGTYQIRYLSKGEWFDGPAINYIIRLND